MQKWQIGNAKLQRRKNGKSEMQKGKSEISEMQKWQIVRNIYCILSPGSSTNPIIYVERQEGHPASEKIPENLGGIFRE